MRLGFLLLSLVITTLVLLQIHFINDLDVNLLIDEFIIIDFYCIIVGAVIFKNILHPYLVFIYLFNMFIGSRIIIDFLGGDSFAYTTYFTLYKFSDVVQINMILMCILALITFNLGVLIANCIIHDNDKMISRDDDVIKCMLICMSICMVPSIIYYYERMKVALSEGYGVGSLLLAQAYDSPLQYFANFLLLFYYVFLAAKPKKQEFYIVTIMQMIILLLSLIGGERGTFALNISLIFVYYTTYIKKIDWKIIFAVAMSLVLVFEFINDTRGSQEYGNVNFTINDMVREFFIHQGVSLNVLGYAYQFEDESSCMDVLYPVANFLGDHLVDDYRDSYISNIDYAHKISKLANASFYYNGHGAGTSYIAELYSAGGYAGILIGSMFLGILMMLMLKRYRNTLYGCFLLLILLKSMFWMPRGAYLSWLTEGIRYLVYMYVILHLWRTCRMLSLSLKKYSVF